MVAAFGGLNCSLMNTQGPKEGGADAGRGSADSASLGDGSTDSSGHAGSVASAGGEAGGAEGTAAHAEAGAQDAMGNADSAEGGDATGDLDSRTAMLLGLADGHDKPIADAHVHIYQPSRPGGVPWPDPSNPVLYKDYLPSTYLDDTARLGILLTNVVEASSIDQDTFWVIDQIKGDSSFFNYSAELDPTSADFIQNLDTYTVDSATCPTCGDMARVRVERRRRRR
jgi:hypothetical protein